MKTAIRTTLVVAATSLAAQAAPFLSMGDSAELFLTGTLGVRSDDNVLLSQKKTSDIIFEVTPGVDLVFGNNSVTKGHVFFKEAFNRYADESALNTNLASAGFGSTYNDEKTKGTFDAGFSQVAQNTVDVRSNYLVRRDIFNVKTTGEVSLTEKSSVSIGASFNDTNYKPASFDDSKIVEVPLNYYYKTTAKLDMSAGVSYRNTNLGKGTDSNDYFYNVGVRGELTPKLTGKVAVGYIVRDYSKGTSDDGFGIDSSVTYAYDEKTNYTAGITNDFGVSGTGASQRNTSYSLGAQSKVSDEWAMGFNVSYRNIAYLGAGARTDKYFESTATVTYTVSSQVSIVGGYTYRDNNSALAGGDFKNNVFSVAANIRY